MKTNERCTAASCRPTQAPFSRARGLLWLLCAAVSTLTSLPAQYQQASIDPQPAAPRIEPRSRSTTASTIVITGEVDLQTQSVEVSRPTGNFTEPVHRGQFRATIPLQANVVNFVSFTALAAGGQRSAVTTLQITRDISGPALFVDGPTNGSRVSTDHVDVFGRISDTLSGFDGMQVTVNDMPANVDVGIGTNGTYFIAGVPLLVSDPPEATEIRVVATDALGNTSGASTFVTYAPIPAGAPRMEVVAGAGQIGRVNSRLGAPVVVRMLNAQGQPFVGKLATFTVTRSNGRLSIPGSSDLTLMKQVRTDQNGLAAVNWTLGSDAGCGNNRVEVTSRDIAGTTQICASATPNTASQINIGTGNRQMLEVNAVAPEPLRVWVNDGCNGVAAIGVTFTVMQGDGKVNGATSAFVVTSRTGHAEVSFQAGATEGISLVEAAFPNNPGLPARLEMIVLRRNPAQPTQLGGRVMDNSSQPLGNCPVDLTVNGAAVAQVVSEADGTFLFDNIAQAGPARLAVHGLQADLRGGRQVPTGTFPEMVFFPTVIANVRNELSQPVLLPLLEQSNWVSFDNSRDIELTCSCIAGLKFLVRAGSMTLADGTQPSPQRPVQLAVNQVDSDSIPMPLPNGAASPFAWTLQPSGALFNPPVQVTIPNMAGLPSGSVAYILSYDHDSERFEIASSASVSSDGALIISDAESGVSKSGWGGSCPPYPAPSVVESDLDLEDDFAQLCLCALGESLRHSGANPTTGVNGSAPVGEVGGLTPGNSQPYWDPVSQAVCSGGSAGNGAFGSPRGPAANPRRHDGADFIGVRGVTPVFAMFDGTVEYVTPAIVGDACGTGPTGSGYGRRIVVSHQMTACPQQPPVRFRTMYAHLASVGVTEHQPVTRGQQIGVVGVSGNACNSATCMTPQPHVHVEIFPDAPGARSVPAAGAGCDPSLFLPLLADAFVASAKPPSSNGIPDPIANGRVSFNGSNSSANALGGFRMAVSASSARLARVRMQWFEEGRPLDPPYVSEWLAIAAGSTQRITTAQFRPLLLLPPDSLQISTRTGVTLLTMVGQTAQLQAVAILPVTGPVDLTARTNGTTYGSSNSGIVAVDPSGLVTATGRGIAYVTAENEGVSATMRLAVTLSSDVTSVEGFVLRPDRAPAVGASISLQPGGFSATTDATGFFSVPGVPIDLGDIFVDVALPGSPPLAGESIVTPVAGAISDAGVIVLSDAVEWVAGTGFWNVATNWRPARVPNAADHVVIDRPGAITVTINSGQQVIRSLRCEEILVVGTGSTVSSLEVTNPYRVNNTFRVVGFGQLRNSRVLPGIASPLFQTEGGHLQDVTVDADLTVRYMPPPPAVQFVTTCTGLTINGRVGFSDNPGNNRPTLRCIGGRALRGRGIINLATSTTAVNARHGIIDSDGSGLVTGPDLLILGPGTIGSANQPMTLGGTVRVPANTTNLTTITGSTWSNTGTINISGGLNVMMTGASWRNMGSIAVTSGGVTLAGGWQNLGAISLDGGGMNLTGTFAPAAIGSIQRGGGNLALLGTLDLGGATLGLEGTSGTLTLNGGTIRNGRVVESATSRLLFTGSAANRLDHVAVEGDLFLTGSGAQVRIAGDLDLSGTASLTGQSARILFEGSQSIQRGTISLESNVSGAPALLGMQTQGVLTIMPGVRILGANGRIGTGSVAMAVVNQGSVEMQAPAIIDADVTNEGLIAVAGASATGIVTINGSYLQTSLGTLQVDIAGGTPGDSYDQLSVSGSAMFGGSLGVSVIPPFIPVLGAQFQVVSTSVPPSGSFLNTVPGFQVEVVTTGVRGVRLTAQ